MKETLPSLMIFNIEYLTSRAVKHFSTRIFVLVPFNYFYSWTMKQKKHKKAIYMYIHGIWSVYKKVVKWKKLFKKKEKEIFFFFSQSETNGKYRFSYIKEFEARSVAGFQILLTDAAWISPYPAQKCDWRDNICFKIKDYKVIWNISCCG